MYVVENVNADWTKLIILRVLLCVFLDGNVLYRSQPVCYIN